MKLHAFFLVLTLWFLFDPYCTQAQTKSLLDIYHTQKGVKKIETGLQICDSLLEKPEEHLKFSLKLAKNAEKNIPNTMLLARIYRSIGDAYYYLNDLDRSNEFLLLAINTSETSNSVDTAFVGGLYNDLGINYQDLDQFTESKNALNKAIQLLSGKKHLSILADAKSNLATLYHQAGKFADAIRYFKEAYEIDKKVGDPVRQSSSLNSLGRMYVDWGKYKTGLEYYFRSAELLDSVKNSDMLAIRYNNIGMTYQLQGNHPEAIRWIEKAKVIEEKSGKSNKLGIRYFNLGSSYMALKDYKQAKILFEKSYDIFSSFNLTQEQSKITASLGQLYFDQGNYKKAFSYFLQSEKFAQESGFLPEKSNVYFKLYQYFKQTGDYKNALKYFDLHVNAKDSIFNLNAAKQIEELEIQYQTAQKELEITKLETTNELNQKEISFRKRERNIATFGFLILAFFLLMLYRLFTTVKKQKKVLDGQNKELEKLNGIQNQIFSIISHDFRSITSSYMASAKIIEHYLNKGQPEKLLPIASEIGKNSKNLSSMLENLLQWAVLKRKGFEPAKNLITVKDYVKQAAGLLKDQFEAKNNALIINAADEKVFCDPESLSIILRNIMANANKFTQDGNITIDVRSENNFSYIKITDSGTGMDQKTINTLFQPGKDKTRQGTAGEKGTGIGLLLVTEHLKENFGEIKVSSEAGKGTCFEIKLPNTIQ